MVQRSQLAAKYEEIEGERAMKLTQMIMKLFDHWGLTYEEQAQMLGLSHKTHSTISRYKKGLSSIRFDRDIYDRVRFLLSIHQSLRTIFPMNIEMAYAWPKTPNQAFRQTPVELIFQEGFLGLARVHSYLENFKTR